MRECLLELEDVDGAERLESAYQAALREYGAAHEAQAHSGRFGVWEPGWHRECEEWQRRHVPALRHLPDATQEDRG